MPLSARELRQIQSAIDAMRGTLHEDAWHVPSQDVWRLLKTFSEQNEQHEEACHPV